MSHISSGGRFRTVVCAVVAVVLGPAAATAAGPTGPTRRRCTTRWRPSARSRTSTYLPSEPTGRRRAAA
ncbi:hypothetical protein ABT301_28165 [Streptomyces sp. NPDC000987]|uniref:hypothetical protein n=1 Tax=Streptomyces sp. NPDC000987 TaxID=3154374 RepID=UPI0033225FE8